MGLVVDSPVVGTGLAEDNLLEDIAQAAQEGIDHTVLVEGTDLAVLAEGIGQVEDTGLVEDTGHILAVDMGLVGQTQNHLVHSSLPDTIYFSLSRAN